ncbi:MAG: hypothetical protein GTO29_13525 [Candidatus Latescibacteria bacterium]|nr:hypothetical protein [Candidatus Latescibacterota bacterium]NIO57272.1 hypothetical protein [Candidatus Latescibacterota bacterium]
MKRFSSIFCVTLLVLAAAASLVQATQILYQSPKQMGRESPLVVKGKVATSRSFWNEKRTKIFTETFVDVDETYKGTGGSTVRIIQIGGVVGNVRMHVHGALSWRPGEEVLLFLEPYGTEGYRVSGFSQGKFEIERDPKTGEAFITRPALEGVEVLGAPVREGAAPVSRTVKIRLDQFIEEALNRR